MNSIVQSFATTGMLDILGLLAFFLGGHMCFRSVHSLFIKSSNREPDVIQTYEKYYNWSHSAFVFICILIILFMY